MKILMTTSGGFVRQMESWSERILSKELIKLGHDVSGFTSSSVKKVFPDSKKKEEIDKIKVRRFNPYNPFSILYMKNFDLIHSHFPGYDSPLSSWAAIRKKIKDIPMVHTIHGLFHDPFLVKNLEDPFSQKILYKNVQKKFTLNPKKMFNWFSHLPIYSSDIILPQSQFEKNELIKLGIEQERIRVVPTSGIDIEKYKNLPEKNHFKKKYKIKENMVLFVGQTIPRKGPEYLIKSIPNVLKNNKNTDFVFVGYKKNKKIEDLCGSLNVKKNVKFMGFLPEKEKIAAYVSADVYCLPTLYEGFGLTYLEAMAAGTPIITTSTPGIEEILKNKKNALLIPPKNSEKISESIIELLNNKKLRDSLIKENKKHVLNYAWKNISKKILDVYEDLI